MFDFRVPLLATAALVAGPVWFARGFRRLRTQRLVRDTPTARIRSMPMGLVELCGQAVPRSELAAPFSGRRCAYWEVDVATRSKNSWHVVHREASGHPFYLRDETGLALVYPAGAEVRAGFQLEETCVGVSLPDVYARYLDERRPVAGALWRMGSLRFRERALEEGQRVYVLGTATPRSRSVAVSTEEAVEMTGTDGWRARRLMGLDPEVQAVVRRGENERTYIISQQSERDLTTQLGWQAAVGLVGGPAVTLSGLGYWLLALAAGRWPR
jgi:hypothetical protein